MNIPKTPPDWIPVAIATAGVANAIAALIVTLATGKLYMLLYVVLGVAMVPWAREALKTNRILRETNKRLAENARLLNGR